jgi:RNA polymerase sigma-70 factor (ECF subfamily)
VLDAAISALEPMYREVLLLRDVEGLTAPEVAEVLGIRVDAVKSRLHRARLAVRERVAPALGVPPDSPEARKRRGCPDVLGVFERHLEGDLAPDDCARMEQHLAGCETCRGACSALRQQLSLCRSTPAQVPDSVKHSVQRAIRDLLEKGT